MRTRPASSLPPGAPIPRRHPGRALARAVSWHRRKLAVLAAVAAVLSGLAATAPPGPPTVEVLRTTKPLVAGTMVSPADLEPVAVPDEIVPDAAVVDEETVVGRRLAAPVSRGQILTTTALVSPRSVTGTGRVLAPVRLADADAVALLRAGDRIDVLAADNETGLVTTVSTAARVVTIPTHTEESQSAETGALVVLEVDKTSVAALTHALSTSRLSLVWS